MSGDPDSGDPDSGDPESGDAGSAAQVDTEPKAEQEIVDVLAKGQGVRIERIVSTGQTSPPGFWYDQAESEWVILLKGSAKIEFEDGELVALIPGDYFLIEPHRRHRVAFTDLNEPTVWLAVFFCGNPGD